jgi:hypothetical protein
MKKLLILPVIFLALAGCAGPSQDYVDADALTYNALAADAVYGIKNNPALDEEQKKRHLNTVKTWRLRLEKAGHADVPDFTGETR